MCHLVSKPLMLVVTVLLISFLLRKMHTRTRSQTKRRASILPQFQLVPVSKQRTVPPLSDYAESFVNLCTHFYDHSYDHLQPTDNVNSITGAIKIHFQAVQDAKTANSSNSSDDEDDSDATHLWSQEEHAVAKNLKEEEMPKQDQEDTKEDEEALNNSGDSDATERKAHAPPAEEEQEEKEPRGQEPAEVALQPPGMVSPGECRVMQNKASSCSNEDDDGTENSRSSESSSPHSSDEDFIDDDSCDNELNNQDGTYSHQTTDSSDCSEEINDCDSTDTPTNLA